VYLTRTNIEKVCILLVRTLRNPKLLSQGKTDSLGFFQKISTQLIKPASLPGTFFLSYIDAGYTGPGMIAVGRLAALLLHGS